MSISQILREKRWQLKLGKSSLVVEVDSKEIADLIVDTCCDELAVSAANLSRGHTCVRWSRKKGYEHKIPALWAGDSTTIKYTPFISEVKEMSKKTPIVTTPGIELGALRLSMPILKVFEGFMADPAIKGGLVRIADLSGDEVRFLDERQVALTEASAELIVNSSLEEAVTRQRSSYWHPDYLRKMNEQLYAYLDEIKKGLKKPEEIAFDFCWLGVSLDRSSWRQFTNRYGLVVDDRGIAYQVSQNLRVESAEPQLVVMPN